MWGVEVGTNIRAYRDRGHKDLGNNVTMADHHGPALAVVSCSCKRGLYSEAQAGLELLVLLPQPPEYWNHKHVLSPLPG